MKDVSWPQIVDEHRRIFGQALEIESVTREFTNPVKTELLTQKISRDSSIARDRRMVDAIVQGVKQSGRVFAVAGASHVVMQQRALEHLLK